MIRTGGALGVWLPVALVGLLTCIVPVLTLPTVQFGVRVPADKARAPVVVAQRRAYFWRTGILAVGLFAVALFVAPGSPWLTVVLVFAQLAGSLGCYFLARENIAAVKDAENWFGGLRQTVATDTTWRTDPEPYPLLWLMPALAVILGTAIVGIVRYPRLPHQLAIHFSTNGTVDGYADKSVWTAFAVVITQLAVTVLIAGLLRVTYRSRPETDAADAEGSIQRYRRFLAVMARALLILAALVDITLMLVAFQVWSLIQPSSGVTGLITMPVIAGIVVLVAIAVRLGQAGWRLRREPATPDSTTVNRDDDRFWLGGLIYVNRRDPAVIVARRFGVGWTLNFGNPMAWVVFVIIIAAAVTLIIVRHR
jgi:uncharacterized membrane protein